MRCPSRWGCHEAICSAGHLELEALARRHGPRNILLNEDIDLEGYIPNPTRIQFRAQTVAPQWSLSPARRPSLPEIVV